MKTVTPVQLQNNISDLLAEILAAGDPIEIDWGGKLFNIVPVEKKSKLDNLVPHPDVYVGDPEDLVNISWEHEINLDLP